MRKKPDIEGPSTRRCRSEGCDKLCSGRNHFCPECRKQIYADRREAHMTGSVRECGSCKQKKDCEEFIRGTKENRNGHHISIYGSDCDDCAMTADWLQGVTTPDVTGHPPYEAARRLLAYEFRCLPSKWMKGRTGLARLHHLVMCKMAGIRLEGIDLAIQEARSDIAQYGPL